MASGKNTPQYKAVQKSIEVITHHLVVSEDAKEDLRLKYIKHNWLAKHAKPCTGECSSCDGPGQN